MITIRKAELTLVFIGDSNWDTYADKQGYLWSIAKPGSGASDSHFGDKYHILKLLNQGFFGERQVTEAGLELLEGLCAVLLPDGGHFYTFNCVKGSACWS